MDFKMQREQLQFLVNIREAGQVQHIDEAVLQIIQSLGQPTSPKEEHAAQIVASAGGPYEIMNVRAYSFNRPQKVLNSWLCIIGGQNDAALAEIAKLLGDRVTSFTQETLRADLDELMENNMCVTVFLLW